MLLVIILDQVGMKTAPVEALHSELVESHPNGSSA